MSPPLRTRLRRRSPSATRICATIRVSARSAPYAIVGGCASCAIVAYGMCTQLTGYTTLTAGIAMLPLWSILIPVDVTTSALAAVASASGARLTEFERALLSPFGIELCCDVAHHLRPASARLFECRPEALGTRSSGAAPPVDVSTSALAAVASATGAPHLIRARLAVPHWRRPAPCLPR